MGSLLHGGERFSFAVIGDQQLGMVELDRDTRSFAMIAAALDRLAPPARPRFVLVAGDLVNSAGNREQLRRFAEAKAGFRMPVWLVPGNHDVARDGRTLSPELVAAFRREIAPDRFAFAEGGCFFIGLDSQLWTSAADAAEQLEWFAGRLGEAGGKPIFVLQHHPLYLDTVDEPDSYWNTPGRWRERLLALIERWHVRAVLTGHLQRDRSKRWRGVSFLTTPSTCKNLDHSKSGCRLITVERDGSFSARLLRVPADGRGSALPPTE